MATPTSTVELLDVVRKSGVLSEDVLKRLENGPSLPESPGKLAAALVKQGLLTQFQAKLLLAGKHRGFRLGSYIVRDQLGQGGMGAVYLAEHESLKRKVALKVLTADKDPLAVKRFAREARAAAALDHPNIVRLFDVAKHGEVHYLVMEYVDGRSMEQLLAASGPLPYGQVVGWCAQVASGLQHAHEQGFVHRDIKPANLMVTKAGQAKLLDMGLARSGDAGDKLTEMMDKGAVVGTADYISPEQAIHGQCDIRADIYALGATIYTLTAGRPPFEGTTSQKLIAHQMKTPPSLARVVAGFPQELADVVEKMMAKKPEDRFQTPAEVADALAPWASEGSAVIPGSVSGLLTAGAGSSVDLGTPPTSGAIVAGSSTKRLATPSSKTTPTPVVSVHRTPPPASGTGKPVAAKTGVVKATVVAAAAPSGKAIKAKPASGKRPKGAARKGPPPWVVFAASGVSGFVIVGIAVLFVFGSKKKPPVAVAPPQPTQPVAQQPKPAANPAPTPPPAGPPAEAVAAKAAALEAVQNDNWREAADKFALVAKALPRDYEPGIFTLTVLARAGDQAGYDALRKEMIAKFSNDPDARARERVSKACALRPGTGEDMGAVALMAESALAELKPGHKYYGSYPLYQMAVAMAKLRMNELADADRLLDEVLKDDPKPGITRTGVATMTRVLVQQRMGQTDKAKETLAAAVEQEKTLAPNGITASSWQDGLIYLILKREAEAALGSSVAGGNK